MCKFSFFGGFVNEGLVNMRDHTTSSNGTFDECIELLIASNGELQMPWCDSLHFQIFACISGQLKHLCCQVF